MMNSAPGIETAEISDADLDNVAGGLNAQAGVVVGADVVAQAGAATDEVLATVGQCAYVGVSVSV
ncbi:hypothetical protein [Streptomyces sp. NPDC090994]|uniref:hypothetical protein n=1 Tax=Streptomyces sp. NPDC090994 TaxID=3365969 RepID=UPI00381CD756